MMAHYRFNNFVAMRSVLLISLILLGISAFSQKDRDLIQFSGVTVDAEDLLVGEIAEPFDISMQAISKHVQVLVKAGLISQERTGRISRCRLDAGPIACAAVWLNQYSKYWQNQFDTLVALMPSLKEH